MSSIDYTKFNVEDLASDHSFVQWAHGTDSGAVQFWERFRREHPEMEVRMTRARILVLNLKKVQETRHNEELIEDLWAKIDERIPYAEQPRKATFAVGYMVAAAVTVVLVAIALYLPSANEPMHWNDDVAEVTDREMIEEVNTSGGVRRIYLSDGSTVALENNSRLKYRRSFLEGEIREVYLSGEAFFDVARNPAQPFIVNTNDLVTRVLGTSFRVIAPDNEGEVIVAVKTGKVSVYSRKGDPAQLSPSNAVILLPNQQVTYVREDDAFGKALVPEPEIVQPAVAVKDFNFDNAPIRDVFRVLEDAYGIEIIFDEEVMANCFVTAPLESEPLFEKLRIICRAIGARYETIDARVVITSTGC